jgi:hypothetical protein
MEISKSQNVLGLSKLSELLPNSEQQRRCINNRYSETGNPLSIYQYAYESSQVDLKC